MKKKNSSRVRRGFLNSLFDERTKLRDQAASIEKQNKDKIARKREEMLQLNAELNQRNARQMEGMKADRDYLYSLHGPQRERNSAEVIERATNHNSAANREILAEQTEMFDLELQREFTSSFRRISTHSKQGRWYSRCLAPFMRRLHAFVHVPEKADAVWLHLLDQHHVHEQRYLRLYRLRRSDQIVGSCMSSDGKYIALYGKRAIDVYHAEDGEHVQSHSCRRLGRLWFLGDSYTMIGAHFLNYQLYDAVSNPDEPDDKQIPSSMIVMQDSLVVGETLIQTDGVHLALATFSSTAQYVKTSLTRLFGEKLSSVRLLGSSSPNCVLLMGKKRTSKLGVWRVEWGFDSEANWRATELYMVNDPVFPTIGSGELVIGFLPDGDVIGDYSTYLIGSNQAFLLSLNSENGYLEELDLPHVSVMNHESGTYEFDFINFDRLLNGWQGMFIKDNELGMTELFPIDGPSVKVTPPDWVGPMFSRNYDGRVLVPKHAERVFSFSNSTVRRAVQTLVKALGPKVKLRMVGSSQQAGIFLIDIELHEDA